MRKNGWDVESDFYEEYEVMFDNVSYRPLRGHGQGMANNLTTLMQIVIFKMAEFRMCQLGYEDHFDALFLNDDSCVWCPADSIDDFIDVDDEIC